MDNYELLSEALGDVIILREELAELRALITAWADAEEALTRYTVLGTHRRNPDIAANLDADVDAAYQALRRAVGR